MKKLLFGFAALAVSTSALAGVPQNPLAEFRAPVLPLTCEMQMGRTCTQIELQRHKMKATELKKRSEALEQKQTENQKDNNESKEQDITQGPWKYQCPIWICRPNDPPKEQLS